MIDLWNQSGILSGTVAYCETRAGTWGEYRGQDGPGARLAGEYLVPLSAALLLFLTFLPSCF
ncbi:hypothetical protein DIPPA_23657 [Diplonema papillatum]|nr:hypothetical protein DIPPA_23657 [Diplonema papillatum]